MPAHVIRLTEFRHRIADMGRVFGGSWDFPDETETKDLDDAAANAAVQ